MQFRDKTTYVWGLRYRRDPSLSRNQDPRIPHFMPPWQLHRIGVWLGIHVFHICIQICFNENNLVELNTFNTTLISQTCLLCIIICRCITFQKQMSRYEIPWNFISFSQAKYPFLKLCALSASKTLIFIPALLQVETPASFPDPSFPLRLPPSFKETLTPRRKVAVERSVWWWCLWWRRWWWWLCSQA